MDEQEKEILDLVKRYENMVNNQKSSWFDSMELVDIIDYYDEKEEDDKLEEVTLRAYKLFPNEEDVVVRMVNLFLSKEDYRKAEKLIKEYTKKHHSEELQGLLAAVYVESNTHLKKAEEILKELLISDSDLDSYYRYLLARIYIGKNKFVDAEKLLRNVVKEHYDDWYLLMNYVKCATDKQMTATVFKVIRGILNKHPFEDRVWVALSIAYYETYYIDKALDAINYAIAIDSEEETRHALKANIVIALGREDEYISESLIAAEYSPEKYTYYEGIAKAYLNKREINNAVKYYNKALEYEQLGISLPESDLGLVECYLLMNNTALASKQLDRALAKDYNLAYYLGFADRINSLGFVNLSEEIFSELSLSDNEFISVMSTVSLAYLRADKDNLFYAIKTLEDAIKNTNGYDTLYYALLDLSCRDSKYIAYTKKAMQHIINQKGFKKEIKENFPSLLKNSNYLRCLKELVNE